MNPSKPEPCRWLGLQEALTIFAKAADGTQGQRHIKPLHWYVACRLVIEGGFHPDEIKPRPPFVVRRRGGSLALDYDAGAGTGGEQTVLGGLKTKQIDVVVSKEGIGPCVAVSMKGTLNAFRNLTNRMEEAAGDCTNLHISYPTLVYAFWNVLRANRAGARVKEAPFAVDEKTGSYNEPQDVALDRAGRPSNQITRYHQALVGLTGRSGIRNEVSRYEACGMTLVEVGAESFGAVCSTFPKADSILRYENMFAAIYNEYDLRFVYQAPDLVARTRRRQWSEESGILSDPRIIEFEPRIATRDITQ